MVVLIFIGAPPPPYLHMDPFSQPKPEPKKQYHSKYYRDARNRDASGASEASSADEEPQKNHVDPLPPSPPHLDAVNAPRTPSPSSDNTRPSSWITGRTPYSRGTTSLNVCNPGKKVGPVDPYLKEDLRHRLFIDFDTFLQTILLLPADWRTSFKSAIDHVLADKEFNGLLNEYLKKVNVAVVDHDREKRLYRPHAKMCNRAVNVLQTHQDTKVSDDNIVHYHRMDPLVVRGSKDQLKPDIVGMLTQIFASPKDKLKLNALEKYGEAQDVVKRSGGLRQKPIPPLPENNIPAWPQLIDAKEMKATDNALDEGTNAIRLLKAGQDPLKPVPRKKRDGSGLSATTDCRTSVDNQASDIPSASRTKKRKSDSSDESSSKVSRRTYDSQASASARRVLDPIDEDGFPRHLPNDEKARIQCATYAMQILSSAGLRSHALVTLIDRDRLQLTYYDRSAIVVSQAIDIADKEEKRLFVGMLIGCHRLTLPQRGILDHIIEDPYIRGFGKMEERNPITLFDGLKMTLAKSDGTKIILTLGSIVHRQRCLIGRDTCVVLARSAAWPGRELVVKISWPSIHRDSEKKLMDAAKAKADEMAGEGKRHWVLDHLPEILHSQDFHFDDEDSPQRRLIELLIEASYVDEKTFIYEERLLRIIVSERLFPITDLADVKDIAQAFHDIFRCHSWLYENPKILHRDMSLKNMMYRRRYHDDSKQEFQILGVLNDYDLASFLPLKEASSLHRTGTPPYMAHELLGKSDVSHLYRHDVEAFYYVLLMLCCRYEIVQSAEGKVMKELELKNMPFAQWFDRTLSWEGLSDIKCAFLTTRKTIPTSASFSAFLPWLEEIRYLFRKGIDALSDLDAPLPRTRQQSHSKQPRNAEPSVPFDNETLGGYIISTEILEIMSDINGHSLNNQS
ncbi:uncharacterized protein EV420DRAFT_1766427 [Desarmillaria tabescens]|uniref:Protein kinase domain-containing protein n=1 Tax=Armillaria tabescens TaxID=1929756 RepID=A0AA39MYZ8_ARMTA|nr:uncharacterized protein EV420DRAFT_1766427 [Desarmillaria tabescens]KAK0451398.1 hypothetical protein EV420DRAFT_1766427 [Desarmillaria tabescens]